MTRNLDDALILETQLSVALRELTRRNEAHLLALLKEKDEITFALENKQTVTGNYWHDAHLARLRLQSIISYAQIISDLMDERAKLIELEKDTPHV